MRALAGLLLTLALAAPALAQAPDDPPPDTFPAPYVLGPEHPEDLPGAVDVCVRWGADPAHVSDVILVASSGDKDLDAKIPDMIRSIPYPKPDGDTGEWFGLSLSFSAAPPHAALPDCDAVVKAAKKTDTAA